LREIQDAGRKQVMFTDMAEFLITSQLLMSVSQLVSTTMLASLSTGIPAMLGKTVGFTRRP